MRNKILGSNKKLRQALGMVINRRKFIDQILDGRGVVLDSLVPSTLASNHVSLGFKWYEHDLSAAKILMKEAGFPEGKGLPEFRYLTATHGTAQKQYEFFRRAFAEVGVRLKFDSVPVTSYYKRLEAGDFEVTLQGWYADFPDPENFTGLLTTYARSQGQNYGAWSYGAYDKLSDSSKLVAPGKERDQLFLGMAEIIREEVPVIPLFSPLRAGIYPKDWVRNFKRDVEGHRDPIHIDIDVAKQKEGFRL
jgi:ABC-type transport system substrate-binding protein